MWGWEPTEYHEPVYEGGDLVGWKVTRDPEFTPEQVDLLLAHLENEADKGWHGHPLSEATDPANQFAYEGKGPRMDWAAAAIGKAQDAFREANPKTPMHGMQFYAVRRADQRGKAERL